MAGTIHGGLPLRQQLLELVDGLRTTQSRVLHDVWDLLNDAAASLRHAGQMSRWEWRKILVVPGHHRGMHKVRSDELQDRLKKIPPRRFLKALGISLRHLSQRDRQMSLRGGGCEAFHLLLDEIQNLFLKTVRLRIGLLAISMTQSRNQVFSMQRFGGLQRRHRGGIPVQPPDHMFHDLRHDPALLLRRAKHRRHLGEGKLGVLQDLLANGLVLIVMEVRQKRPMSTAACPVGGVTGDEELVNIVRGSRLGKLSQTIPIRQGDPLPRKIAEVAHGLQNGIESSKPKLYRAIPSGRLGEKTRGRTYLVNPIAGKRLPGGNHERRSAHRAAAPPGDHGPPAFIPPEGDQSTRGEAFYPTQGELPGKTNAQVLRGPGEEGWVVGGQGSQLRPDLAMAVRENHARTVGPELGAQQRGESFCATVSQDAGGPPDRGELPISYRSHTHSRWYGDWGCASRYNSSARTRCCPASSSAGRPRFTCAQAVKEGQRLIPFLSLRSDGSSWPRRYWIIRSTSCARQATRSR
jgi:hypothetical protein